MATGFYEIRVVPRRRVGHGARAGRHAHHLAAIDRSVRRHGPLVVGIRAIGRNIMRALINRIAVVSVACLPFSACGGAAASSAAGPAVNASAPARPIVAVAGCDASRSYNMAEP